jgi:hypothetical protein
MPADLQPGARVVWAPVLAGTVVRPSGEQAFVVDLDDGRTITASEGVLVEVPEVSAARA